MKAERWFGWIGAVLVLTLGIVLASDNTASAAPQYNYNCDRCHTMPPTDSGSAVKNPDTGGVPGRHQTHAGGTAGSCVVCHGDGASSYENGHRNKVIELRDSLGYGRKPTDPGFMNQTSVPPNPLASCSAAKCHSNGKGVYTPTPAWSSTAAANCDTCHSSAPNTNKHSKHISTYSFSCDKCHSNHQGEAKPFAHATSAMWDRAIDVHFSTAPNSGGTFTGNANQALASCSAIYCHSDGKASPTYATPTWGGTAGCTACHGGATSGTLSGKHAAHVNNTSVLGTDYGCVNCHAQTVSNNTTISNTAKHVDGSRDMSAAFSCASCHQNGKSGAATVPVTQVANWTDGTTLDCAGCHGTAGTFGAPSYANGGAGAAAANSHAKHATSAATCANCHSETTTSGTSIIAGSQHTDGFINFTAGNGKTFGKLANKTCSNISCHSGGGLVLNVADAQWGATLSCAGCHGNTAGTLTTNSHPKHLNSSLGCVSCHSATVNAVPAIIDTALHANAVANVQGAGLTFNGDKTCATSCHYSATPKWGDASTGACGTCHKAYSDTVNGVIASNGHNAHFSSAYGPGLNGATAGNACATCHLGATHVNGSVQLTAGFAVGGTCGSCHQQAVPWNTTRLDCEKCHTGTLSVIGVAAPDKSSAATSGHGTGAINQGCVACHDNTSAHISGTLGDSNRLLPALGSGNANCSYCHNNPVKVANADKRITQVHVGFANQCSVCHDPHGGTGNSNMLLANFSTNRTNTVAFSGSNFVTADGKGVCQTCHTGTAYYKKNVAETNHYDAGTNCLTCHSHKGADGLTAFEPNRACDSCHGYPPAPRSTLVAVTFGVQNNWSSARFEDYSGGGGAHVVAAHLSKDIKPSDGWAPCLACHNNGAATHNKAMPMRNHVDNVTVKLDPQYRFSDQAQMKYSSAQLVAGGSNKTGTCFNVSCHFRPSPKWSTER